MMSTSATEIECPTISTNQMSNCSKVIETYAERWKEIMVNLSISGIDDP